MYGGWGGVGDWEGVSDGGRGLKLKISKFCNFAIFTQKEHLPAQKPEVYSQKTENRPEYSDFDFLLGNPPKKSTYLPHKNPKFIVKKQKIVLNMRILIFCWATLQLVQNIKPIRIFFCTPVLIYQVKYISTLEHI